MINSGTTPTGTETSCLIEPPSSFWTSDINSRKRQKSLRCSSVAASAASAIEPALQAVAEHALDGFVETALDLRRRFQKHVPGVGLAEGIAHVLAVIEHELQRDALHQFEADDALPELFARQAEQARARPLGLARPMKAVTRERGFGNSFSAAAVMMPSVPSEPTNKSFRS